VSVDPRDQRIAKLEATVEALLQRVDAVEVENRQLRADNATLRAENADLRARLDQNSNNSSKPPSTDGPGVNREPKKPPTGRKPGGQRGHEKHARELLPVEQVDFVVPLVPDHCGKCQGRRLRRSKDEPRRHQQVELPRPKPVVTEYQCHAVDCLDCGAITEGELPPEAVPVFGERLSALVCALMGQYRLSKRNTQRYLADVQGVEVSLGMVPKLGAEMGEALAGGRRTAAGEDVHGEASRDGTRARRTGGIAARGFGPSPPPSSSSSASPSAVAAWWRRTSSARTSPASS